MKNIIFFALVCLSVGCSKQNFNIMDEQRNFDQDIQYNNKVDVIVMIDTSSSMDSYQNKLADQAGMMIDELNRSGMDYHIVVVTSDMRSTGTGGKFIGDPKVLTNKTAGLVDKLKQRIQLGSKGSDMERGLESIRTVLTPSYLSGQGAGFLRDDALLAIVALTNENDYSTEAVSSIKDAFDRLKPPFASGVRAWTLNFIGIPDDSNLCSSALEGQYRDPGLRWIELARASDGVVEPICETTLNNAVRNIKRRITQILTDFSLGREPVVDTIKVTKNGQVVAKDNSNGWEYIPEGFKIRFHGTAIPGAYDKVLVDFTPVSPK